MIFFTQVTLFLSNLREGKSCILAKRSHLRWRRQKMRLSLWIISIQNLQILENNSPLREAEIYWQLPIVLLDPAEALWSFLLLLQWQFLQSSRQCSSENTFRNTLVMITGKVSIRCHSIFAIQKSTIKKQHIWTKERSWSKFQHIDVSLSMSTVVEINHLILT